MHRLLRRWDRKLDPAQHAQLDIDLARRSFISDSFKAAAGLGLAGNLLALAACRDRSVQAQSQLAQTEPWHTFAITQQHLFPDDGNGPGADTVNATVYLQFVLEASDTDPLTRQYIYDGVDWLNQLAVATHRAVFAGCDHNEREKLLSVLAQSRNGERWLSFLLTYLFEALLSDPVYGANPDGIGWKWLEHVPGFPRPPVGKRYFELT